MNSRFASTGARAEAPLWAWRCWKDVGVWWCTAARDRANRARRSGARSTGAGRVWSDALEAGCAILAQGGTAVDAVESAARVLEENACFNAGRGSVLTEQGEVELDAAIMDGRGRQAGAVAGIKTTRAPISLARRLMEHGPHVFLVGAAADRFAATAGIQQVANDFFILPERRRQLEELLRAGSAADPIKYGTIGAVASDVMAMSLRRPRPAASPPSAGAESAIRR